jgi:hypothetical protein
MVRAVLFLSEQIRIIPEPRQSRLAFRLLGQVMRVSVETVGIVRGLPDFR